MILFRLVIFNGVFFGSHLVLVVVLSLLLALPRRWAQAATRGWTKFAGVLLRTLVGLDFEVRGRPPEGPCIIVSKHQSAWDTFIFYLLLNDPNYVLKKELTQLPLWGRCALKCGAGSVDRAGGGKVSLRLSLLGLCGTGGFPLLGYLPLVDADPGVI